MPPIAIQFSDPPIRMALIPALILTLTLTLTPILVRNCPAQAVIIDQLDLLRLKPQLCGHPGSHPFGNLI